MTYEFYEHDVVSGSKKFFRRIEFIGSLEERRARVHEFAEKHLSHLADPNHGYPRHKDFWSAEATG